MEISWFVSRDGQPAGPFSEAELVTAALAGEIGPDTLVWHEGMPAWTRLIDEPSAPSLPGISRRMTDCSECRRSVPLDETVPFRGHTFCAACKPVVLMRIEEGLPPCQGPAFARFGTRLSARFVDMLGLWIVTTAIQIPIVGIPLITQITPDSPGFWVRQIAAMLVGVAGNAAYYIVLHGRSGQTLGKRLMRIRVVRADGSPLGFGKATSRFFADMLSSMTLFIGYLMAAFDEEHRALHDRLCDTRVVELR
ncbi:MAG TPA: RDD family protein [Thermoanaerobaculia bacterium]|nr:RDD family protein [Thermoanaerobaculia bacterium]HPA50641.1 RDD family protein [Thermoanaerobaculia bacterium]HQN07418.1 RDD family protein [Thermoanaerobaculia bacterium]HQP85726.1 RDD family protein [Thermoanaerobaculia bacterium]